MSEAQAPAQGVVRRAVAAFRAHWSDPLYRNSYYLMFDTGVVAVTGFLFWLIAARIAPPSDVGLAVAVVNTLILVATLGKAGVDFSLLRFLPGTHGEDARRLVNTAFTATALLATLAALVFLAGTPWWAPELAWLRAPGLAAGFVLATIVVLQWTLLDTLFIARRSTHHVVWKNVGYSVLRLAFLWPFAVWWGAAGIAAAVIAGMLVSLVVGALVGLPRVEAGFTHRLALEPAVLRRLVAPSFANFLVSLLVGLPATLGPLIILNRLGADAVAVFYVLWTIGGLGLIAPAAFGQTLLVEISHGAGLRALFGIRPILVTLASALAALVAGVVLLPLFGEHYAGLGVAPLVPFLLATVPGFFLQARMAQFRVHEQRTALIALAAVPVLVFATLLALTPTVALVGWMWLAALTAAAMFGFSWRLRPAPAR